MMIGGLQTHNVAMASPIADFVVSLVLYRWSRHEPGHALERPREGPQAV